METSIERKTAAFTHLSTFGQYLFPFGNYIFPILIWTSQKNKSEFVNNNGKQALNFQLSILIYSLLLILIAITIFLFTVLKNISFSNFINHGDMDIAIENFDFGNNIGILTIGALALFAFACIKVAELFLVIYASIKAANGEKYNYPLTISFIK